VSGAAGDQPLPPLRVAAALVVIALTPFPAALWASASLGPRGVEYATVVFPVDVAIAVLLAAALPSLARSLRRGRGLTGGRVLAGTVGILTVALCAHPSLRGAHLVWELAGAAALASVLAESVGSAWGRLLIGTTGAVALLETAWSLAQGVLGRRVGLQGLGEHWYPFNAVAGTRAPMGSMTHCYVLAGLALVAFGLLALQAANEERPLPWLVTAAIAVAPAGYTYSRAAALGVVLAAAALVAGVLGDRGHRRAALGALLALAIGVGVPAAATIHGWRSRASETTASTDANDLTSGRMALMRQAAELTSSHPVTGVGPGRYLTVLNRSGELDPLEAHFKPVHDVVLLGAAEGGVLAGLALALLLGVLGWRALRAGPLTAAAYLAFLPYWVLDYFPYDAMQGVVLAGLWVGALDGFAGARARRHAGPPRTAVGPQRPGGRGGVGGPGGLGGLGGLAGPLAHPPHAPIPRG